MTYLAGRSILITGGTGSFGRAFVRYALDHLDPQRLVVGVERLKGWLVEQARA